VPEILDRDLSRPDGVRWLLSFSLTAMMMLATSEKENSEEKRDAATHSLFCERISAETGTGGQRRQRRLSRVEDCRTYPEGIIGLRNVIGVYGGRAKNSAR